jgi:hypothetical protein
VLPVAAGTACDALTQSPSRPPGLEELQARTTPRHGTRPGHRPYIPTPHTPQEGVAADNKAHQGLVTAAAETDAVERRITNLYTKAAGQLGAEQAPVRPAGLYALERRAQGYPEQWQTIVNVWCAYRYQLTQLP